jgi:hypothetical protein
LYWWSSALSNHQEYDLAALVLIPDIDETMTVALASVDKSMYPSVASREFATITIPRKTFFIQISR